MSRLSLVTVTEPMKAAFARSRSAFAEAIGRSLPEEWPQFPEAFAPSGSLAAPTPWSGFLFACGEQVVGNGGFVGPPDAAGLVEIGFEVAPAYRNRGYATTAIERLIDLGLKHGAAGVIAHSEASPNASNRSMAKAGMIFIAALPHVELGQVWRFARNV